MRFDTLIELFIIEDVSDGLGGHTQSEKAIASKYANIEEMSLETTVRIYGDAITQRKIRNKTSFFLEVDND